MSGVWFLPVRGVNLAPRSLISLFNTLMSFPKIPTAHRSPKPRRKSAQPEIQLPSATDWRTTDQDEINRRILRAREEQPAIRNLTPGHPVFGNFEVKSRSGVTYEVEVRDVTDRRFGCTCVDFQVNGLGTCKHVEAVLPFLQATRKTDWATARKDGSARIDVVPDTQASALVVERNLAALPRALRALFDADGRMSVASVDELETALARLREAAASSDIRLSLLIAPWLASLRAGEHKRNLRRDYEGKVQSGEFPPNETLVPLYPYQREGMLHLAFTGRALLADEMGLGKTIQAIAACALLHRLGQARRVLVITPASLKTEWEEQIARFTPLPHQIVYGRKRDRLHAYDHAPFFTLVNYEQMLADSLDVNARLRPDIIVLDEAQRIKNWSSKTAQAIKRLHSPFAFVLTGTPLENRLDELYSLVSFLNPHVFGPLFRFNREFYRLDDRGRPEAYLQLAEVNRRIRPYLLRRRKSDVETELPSRTDRNLYVTLGDAQRADYAAHEQQVSKLVHIAKRRPLSPKEQQILLRELAIIRMLCDTPYILDRKDRTCPKLDELERIFDELFADPDVKVIVFSEWQGMLELVRDLCRRFGVGHAWHTGSVPQQKRRAEIRLFKDDPACRVFISTDSGGVGLNLQNASVVINCDLPWNPAKLEQRIARAWRKHQKKPVTVLNLIASDTIEHRMLGVLDAKRTLADGVLDLRGNLDEVPLRPNGQSFIQRLEQTLSRAPVEAAIASDAPGKKPAPLDPAAAFAQGAAAILGARLIACEERYPDAVGISSAGGDGGGVATCDPVLMVIVDRDAESWQARLVELHAGVFLDAVKNRPDTAPRLEVIDRATAQAIERLQAAGLIELRLRATRHLHPAKAAEAAPLPLSSEEQARVTALRAQAVKRFKLARFLVAEELPDEALAALRETVRLAACAWAVERRMGGEPATMSAALAAPHDRHWGAEVETMKALLTETPTADQRTAAFEALAGTLKLKP